MAEWVRVRIAAVAGSAPRETGAEMRVFPDRIEGTIGGGVLEWQAMEAARAMLTGDGHAERLEVALGPEIGQCCGGRVTLDLARNAPVVDAARPRVFVFGAGHTGRALARLLATQPVEAVLIDERAEALVGAPEGVTVLATPLPEAVVRDAPAGSGFVILTHDHALDFHIAAAALARGDAGYVGMIGSASKRAAFDGYLRRENCEVTSDLLICPIGLAGKGDKRPEVIAAFALTEILTALR